MTKELKRSFVLAAVIGLAVGLMPVSVFPQVLPFEVLGLKDGLPQSQVITLAQDHDGYLWVGTWGGLARFNGSEFKSFSLEDGLRSTRIHELLVDRAGTLWIATAGGTAVWKNHRLVILQDPAVDNVRCRTLAEDARGRIWVGTDNGVAVGREGRFEVMHPGGGSSGPVVYDLLPDPEGVVAVAGNGLWRFPPEGPPQAMPGPPGIDLAEYRVAAATSDGLWLGTNTKGVFLRDHTGWHPLDAGRTAGRSIYRMSVEPSGTLYICSNDAGLLLKAAGKQTFEHWTTDNGLPSNVVDTVLEDREGSLWVGTDIGGLARLSGTAVTNHTEKQGLPSACVFGISRGAAPDTLWLSTLRGAALLQARPVPKVLETIRAGDGLENEWVWKAMQTPDGYLWLMTDTILQVRRPGEKSVRILSPDDPIHSIAPWDITIDGESRFWVCGEGREGGLAMRDLRGKWRIWNRTDAGEPFRKAVRVARRRQGGVWVIDRSTILVCDGEKLTKLSSRHPLPASITVSTAFEDSRGRLWIGDDAGMAVMETDGRWQLLNGRPGFTNHHVFNIGEDREQTIWVSTQRGMFLFRPDGRVDTFTPEDGLADWETNQHGFFCDERGELWIGTVNGLSQYNPTRRHPNTVEPRLMVESVRLPGRAVEYPQALDVDWRERSFSFDIAVLSYRNRNRTAYRARMEGLENEWLPLRRLTELRYTNLPAGDLRLLVQPVNESGVWGATVALPIRVRPPFWMTLWFRLTAIGALLAAAVGTHQWRTLVLRRRNEELEREVAKRTAQLEYLATYDPLTGLFNRRAIMSRMEKEIRPEHGENRQLGCIMVDLNRFKLVNDTLGHATGDHVLKEMAKKIQECLRDSDVLGRLGGDEFLVVLPGADLDAVKTVYRRISELGCEVGEAGAAINVTASCGGVAVPGRADTSVAAVLAHADALLYKVKRAGRKGFEVEIFNLAAAAVPADGPEK